MVYRNVGVEHPFPYHLSYEWGMAFWVQKAVGLDCCAIRPSIEVESSSLSARAVFLPQWNPCHQAKSLHDALFIESTAFRLLLYPIHSLFLRPFSPRRAHFCPSKASSLSDVCYRDWHTFGIPEIWFVHLSMKKPLFFRGFLWARRDSNPQPSA